MPKDNSQNSKSSRLSIPIDEKFSIDDLIYAHSQTKAINYLYDRLLNIYSWTHGKKTISYQEMAEKNLLPKNVMPVLIRLGYCDRDCNWLPPNKPRKGDAIYIRLKMR